MNNGSLKDEELCKNIVKINNKLNRVSFSIFKEKELDLFFSILYKIKNKNDLLVSFTFKELRLLSNYSNKNIDRLTNDLDQMFKKILNLNLNFNNNENKKNRSFGRVNLFNYYEIFIDRQTVEIKMNKDFEYLLNNLVEKYTQFELKEFVSLKSTYSRHLFRLLKQFSTTKWVKFEINEFRELLGIPSKYRMSDIDKSIFSIALNELSTYFYELKLEKIKDGRKVTHFKFSWKNKQEDQIIISPEEIDIPISSNLNNAILKAKQNRFITDLLNPDNIEILLELNLSEKDLIKGLNYAYKEIKQEINSLKYLIKTIKTGIEKVNKKIVIESNIENNIEKITDVQIKSEAVVKITEKEYEELYIEHLKTNNQTHNPFIRKAFDIYNKYKYQII